MSSMIGQLFGSGRPDPLPRPRRLTQVRPPDVSPVAPAFSSAGAAESQQVTEWLAMRRAAGWEPLHQNHTTN